MAYSLSLIDDLLGPRNLVSAAQFLLNSKINGVLKAWYKFDRMVKIIFLKETMKEMPTKWLTPDGEFASDAQYHLLQ